MSGGHFGYNCFKISQFAEEFSNELHGKPTEYSLKLDKTDKAILLQALDTIKDAAVFAKDIEWMYSGDICEEACIINILLHFIGKEQSDYKSVEDLQKYKQYYEILKYYNSVIYLIDRCIIDESTEDGNSNKHLIVLLEQLKEKLHSLDKVYNG